MTARRPLSYYFKRFAGAGLLFFLIKGLLWLVVPALLALILR